MKGVTVARMERLRQGYVSARELAEHLGISAGRYQNFEGGDRYRYLNSCELERVAKCLGIPRDVFADAKGAPRMLA